MSGSPKVVLRRTGLAWRRAWTAPSGRIFYLDRHTHASRSLWVISTVIGARMTFVTYVTTLREARDRLPEIDRRFDNDRAVAFRRLAIDMDIPPEVLTSPPGVNHWSALTAGGCPDGGACHHECPADTVAEADRRGRVITTEVER